MKAFGVRGFGRSGVREFGSSGVQGNSGKEPNLSTFERFEDIKAWQAARGLVREIYQLGRHTGLSRDFGLRDQLNRAAVSVMSNIAEGFARNSPKEFARFLDASRASAAEVQSLLYVASDVGHVDEVTSTALRARVEECLVIIAGLHRYLRGSELRNSRTSERPNSRTKNHHA